jgi:hypothetical protein
MPATIVCRSRLPVGDEFRNNPRGKEVANKIKHFFCLPWKVPLIADEKSKSAQR